MSGSWANLIQPVDVGGQVAAGFQRGQQSREQNMAKAAMSRLARDPNDTSALSMLAEADPETAMKFQTQRAELLKQHLGEHSDNILKGAELFRAAKAANPGASDEQAYAVAYEAAQQAGMPLDEVPPPGDPRVPGYVQGLMTIASGLKPESMHNPQMISVPPGGAAAMMGPNGQPQFVMLPNDGSHQAGASAMPQVSDQSSYDAVPPGGQYMTPDGHVRVKGGQAGQSSPAPF